MSFRFLFQLAFQPALSALYDQFQFGRSLVKIATESGFNFGVLLFSFLQLIVIVIVFCVGLWVWKSFWYFHFSLSPLWPTKWAIQHRVDPRNIWSATMIHRVSLKRVSSGSKRKTFIRNSESYAIDDDDIDLKVDIEEWWSVYEIEILQLCGSDWVKTTKCNNINWFSRVIKRDFRI